MANVQLTAGSGTFVATNTVSRDGQTENMEMVNLADPSTGTSASVTAGGTSGTAALAVQGIAGAFPQSVSVGGNTNAITQLSSATSASPLYLTTPAKRLARLIYTGTTALSSSNVIVVIDQASGAANTANIIYQCAGMAAGQVIDLQIPVTNGIGLYMSSGSLSSNLVVTYS